MEEISHRQEPTTRNDVGKALASDFVPCRSIGSKAEYLQSQLSGVNRGFSV